MKIFAQIKISQLNIFKKQYHEKCAWNLALNRFTFVSTFEKRKYNIVKHKNFQFDNLIQEYTSIWKYIYTI